MTIFAKHSAGPPAQVGPSFATAPVGESVDITAVVTGTNQRDVIWSVCDANGENCVVGGNSTVGTIAEIDQDSEGNSIATYTAPASVPSPPDCATVAGGCAVVAKAQMVAFSAACFLSIHITGPSNPVPVLTSLVPASAIAGGGAFTLTVNGTSSFVTTSVVRWDGSDRTTAFVNSTQFTADILASDIASTGTAQVTVFNPTPGGGTSNALTFTITPALVTCTSGVTERVSVASDGTEGNGGGLSSSISPDGRFVVFESISSNLVAGDTNVTFDVFVRDTCVGALGGCVPSTVRVSVASDGTEGNVFSQAPSSSADGRSVSFVSLATNLVSGDTNAATDIFVHDRDSDNNGIFDEAGGIATVRVSVASDGTQGNSNSGIFGPSISATGRFVVFASFASNLVSGDTNAAPDIFVHDRDADEDGILDETGVGERATVRVSVASAGTQGNLGSTEPSMSPDGRFVAFDSSASNLVTGDTNLDIDIFLHDRDADENGIFDEAGGIATVRVSVDSAGGEADASSRFPAVSPGGRFAVFSSQATNLVSGDTNSVVDLFVRDTCIGAPGGCTPATVRVSVASDGTQGDLNSSFIHLPSLSANGRFVAFKSDATNLVPGDTNTDDDVFVHDRDADGNGIFDEPGGIATIRVSVAADGTEGTGGDTAIFDTPSISADGRFVSFHSGFALVTGDTNGTHDSFLAQTCLRLSVAILRNFANSEIDQLQSYLTEMGLGSQLFDQGTLTSTDLQNFSLIIWDDLGSQGGGLSDNDVSLFQQAFALGIPLYLIGDDLAFSGINLSGAQQAVWTQLLHLNPGGNFGGNGTVTIVDSIHPVTNGPFGTVLNFSYFQDNDATTQTNTGEQLLAVSGSDHVIVAFEDSLTGTRSVSQNVQAVNGSDQTGIDERKKLFQNAVTWLLRLQ